MVPRYTRPEMAAIWAPVNRYRLWFAIEAAAADGMAALGAIPAGAARAIRARGQPMLDAMTEADIARIDAIEAETRHDVIAFLTWLAEGLGPDSRFVHQGMTSSDVLDTCLSLQLTQAADLLLADLDRVLAALRRRALEHRRTLTIGRSHGIHAEPTSFGLKLAGHYAEFARNRVRLLAAAGGGGRVRHLRRGRHLRPPRPARGGARRPRARPGGGAGVHPGDRARPPRRVLLHPGGDRQRGGAAGDRGAPPAALRGAGGGGVLPRRAEGQQRDAAQAQPGAEREPDRPGPHRPRRRRAGAGERGAMARARHQPQQRGAGDRPGRDPGAGLRAQPAGRDDGDAGGSPGADARQFWRASAAWCTAGRCCWR